MAPDQTYGPPPYPGPPSYPPPDQGYPGGGYQGGGYPGPPSYPPPDQGYPGGGYQGGGYPGGPYGYGAGPVLASYWSRVGGFLLDTVIIIVIEAVVGVILSAAKVDAAHRHGSTAHLSAAGSIIELIIWLAYAAVFIGSRRGQTPGMMAVRVRAVDRDTGGPIGFWRAVGRAAFETLMSFLFGIGWVLDMLWPAWDARNQTLHDKVTRTVVVRT